MNERRKKKTEDEIAKLYFNPKKPGSFSGKSTFKKTLPPKLKQATDLWINEQQTYNLHRGVIRKFKRTPVITAGVNQQLQIDLIDISVYAKSNDAHTFLLTVIDVFSRKAYCQPLRRKDGKTVTRAFKVILDQMDSLPTHIQSDQGKEFLNSTFKGLLKEYKIRYFTSHDKDIKCSHIERFNRTLMGKIGRFMTKTNSHRFVDVLPDIITSYNNTPHSAIGIPPEQVNAHNQEHIWLKLFNKPRIVKKNNVPIGAYVRIPTEKRTFEKGYLGKWSVEVFVVHQRIHTSPVTYKIKDLAGEVIVGSFYTQELMRVKKPKHWPIERIIDQRKNRYLVKWKGFPVKFNSWVSATDIVDI